MRVAIVNDMRLAVEALRRVVTSAPEHTVAWIAEDGRQAVQLCARDTPDVILMDLVMPEMDGVEATRRIMQDSPCAILVVTATVDGNIALVFEAMGHGALDAVNTPALGRDGELLGGTALLNKLETISHLLQPSAGPAAPPDVSGSLPGGGAPLLAIGASTGGPAALERIFRDLPKDFPWAIVVVQHVDAQFAPDLAAWLGRNCRLPVLTAQTGAAPAAGTISLAASNDHLIYRPDGTLAYQSAPEQSFYRPSVDVFFDSLAHQCRPPGTAVLLTGMGRDGGIGLLALRRAGWRTIAQDRASCVVYGMPRAAAELQAAEMILPLDAIAESLLSTPARGNHT
ncbi:MAG: chemotaxis response regulator protein-glutamate methylesterase [Kiritimatiellia bacterium]|nr:chemotaxis response regulator protein-glutamate methylesterase [Lentisphaerota bacterium]